MTGSYQGTANQRSGRVVVSGQPLILFESTTSLLASLTPVADSVGRQLLAITTARPPMLSRLVVACQSPSRRDKLSGEEQARRPCKTLANDLACMCPRESEWMDVSKCLL